MADDFEFTPFKSPDQPAPAPGAPPRQTQELVPPAEFEFKPAPTPGAKQGPPKPLWAAARDVGQDVLASAASQAYKSVPGVVLGGIPSIERTGVDLATLGRNAMINIGKKMDIYSPAEASAMMAEPWKAGLSEAQKAGLEAPYSGLPTYKGRVEQLRQQAEAGELPPGQAEAATYKPQTFPGKMAAAGVEGAMISAPGGLAGMPSRMLTGAAGQMAGEAAEAYAGHSSSYPFWAALAAAGPMAFGTRNLTGAQADITAQKTLEDSVAKGRANGLTNVTPEQIREAVRSGTPLSVYHMLDPESQELVAKMAGLTASGKNAVNLFNKSVDEVRQNGNERISNFMQNLYQSPLSAPNLTKQMEGIGRAERDQVFAAARGNPAANAIPSSIVGADLLSYPPFQDAIRQATSDAAILAPKYNIVPPKSTPAQPPSPTGLLDASGKPIMSQGVPAIDTPGNLSFYQEVKRRLHDQAEAARADGEWAKGEAIDAARDKLINRLSSVVPEYQTALDKSAATFMRQNAPEAGYMFAGNYGAYKLSEIEDLLRSYTPEQRAVFEQGVASRLNEFAQKPTGVNYLNTQFTRNPDFIQRMKQALSPESFDAIRGKVAAEKLLQDAAPAGIIVPEASKFGAGVANAAKAGGLGAVGLGFAGDMFLKHPELLQAAGTGTATGAAVSAIVAGSALLKTTEQQRIAQRMLPKVFSNDPKDMIALAQLLEKNPQAQMVYERISKGAINAVGNVLKASLSAPARATSPYAGQVIQDANQILGAPAQQPQRNAGGRVARATGGGIGFDSDANALIRAAEIAKNNLGKQTENILDAPDEHVVKALKVANQHIEG